MRTSPRILLSLAVVALLAACGEQSAPTAASSMTRVPLFTAHRPAPSTSLGPSDADRSSSGSATDEVIYTFDELGDDCYWDSPPLRYRDLAFSGALAVCDSYLPNRGKALIPANSAGGAYASSHRATNIVTLPAPASEVSIAYFSFGDSPNHLIAYGPTGAEIARASDAGAGSTGVLTVRGDIRRVAFEMHQISIYLDDLRVRYVVSDATPPTVVASVTGPTGTDGWYTGDATITWQVTDAESAVTSPPCNTILLTAQSAGTAVQCTATSAGGTTTASATVKIDRTAPTVAQLPTGARGSNGWYTGDVTLAWTTSDDVSGASACATATLTTDGVATFGCTTTNGAGLATTASTTLRRDATAPLVSWSGATTYQADEVVRLACSATDATSGIASSECAALTGNAYDFALGETTLTARATDVAGNVGSASVRLNVAVSAASLGALVERWVQNRGIANALMVHLRNGEADSFRKLVDAQTGKSISAEHAAILRRLSMGM